MKPLYISSLACLLSLGALSATVACDDDNGGGSVPVGVGGGSGQAGSSGGPDISGSGGGTQGDSGNAQGGSGGAAAGAAGSGVGGSGGGAFFQVNGKTTGSPAPATARLVVLWTGEKAGADYSWGFGSGTSTGTTFVTALGSDPPVEARNTNGLAVGIVLALKPDGVVPEGKIEGDAIISELVGATAQYAIVWRDASKPGLPWSGVFPAGYACGKCVLSEKGMGLDSFTPVECGSVELEFTPDFATLTICNWS